MNRLLRLTLEHLGRAEAVTYQVLSGVQCIITRDPQVGDQTTYNHITTTRELIKDLEKAHKFWKEKQHGSNS